MTSILFVIAMIYCSQFKCNYLRNKNIFLCFHHNFWNLGQILHVSQKKMSLIAYVFPKLETAKDVVSEMSKKQRFRAPFDSQHPKGCKTLVKSTWNHLYHIFKSFLQKLSRKMSLCVISEILGLCLLTHWLRMTSVLFVMGRIYRNQFKGSYLRNKNFSLIFLLIFWNFHQFLSISKRKTTLIAYVFPKLQTRKHMVDNCLKSPA